MPLPVARRRRFRHCFSVASSASEMTQSNLRRVISVGSSVSAVPQGAVPTGSVTTKDLPDITAMPTPSSPVMVQDLPDATAVSQATTPTSPVTIPDLPDAAVWNIIRFMSHHPRRRLWNKWLHCTELEYFLKYQSALPENLRNIFLTNSSHGHEQIPVGAYPVNVSSLLLPDPCLQLLSPSLKSLAIDLTWISSVGRALLDAGPITLRSLTLIMDLRKARTALEELLPMLTGVEKLGRNSF